MTSCLSLLFLQASGLPKPIQNLYRISIFHWTRVPTVLRKWIMPFIIKVRSKPVQLASWQLRSNSPKTSVHPSYFYLDLQYSNLHFTTLWTTVEKYISQPFRFQFPNFSYDIVLAFLVKPLFSHFWIQFFNAMFDLSFCFCTRWPPKPSPCF